MLAEIEPASRPELAEKQKELLDENQQRKKQLSRLQSLDQSNTDKNLKVYLNELVAHRQT